MKLKKEIQLEAKDVYYYSEKDEEAFFDWLNKIPCVLNYKGVRNVLYISVDTKRVNEESLRELLAFFYRYRISMRQLSIFDTKRFAKWFRNPNGYWFKRVFGNSSQTKKP